MIIPSWSYYLFFTFLLFFFVVSFYCLLQTNFEKIFKQGKIFAIRLGYIFVSLILSFLMSLSVISLIISIYNIFLQ